MHTTAVLVLIDGSHRTMNCDGGENVKAVENFFRDSLKMGRKVVGASVCYGAHITQYTANEVREIANVRV